MDETPKAVVGPTIYCCGCGYVLDGLGRSECPECGLGFDLCDGKSYRHRPFSRWRDYVVRSLVVLFVVIFIFAGYVGWQYRFNILERGVDAKVAAIEGSGFYRPSVGPVWLGDVAKRWGMPRPQVYVNLFFDGTVVKDSDMLWVSRCGELKNLDLTGTEITDEGLSYISGLKKLDSISLSGSKVTDVGLVYLAGMDNLTRLSLGGTEITDRAAVLFQSLDSLKRVRLGNTKVTAAGMVELCNQRKWVLLDFSSLTVDGEVFEALRGQNKLRHLVLDGTRVTDGDLAIVEDLVQLQGLTLNDTEISNQGLLHLKDKPTLLYLFLSNTKVDDVGLEYLGDLPNLRNVYLAGTNITNEGLLHLQVHSRLGEINLSHTNVDDTGLVYLYELAKLERVHVTGTKVTKQGIAKLRKVFPGLLVVNE